MQVCRAGDQMEQSCRAGHESSKDFRDPCEGAREPLDVSRENGFPLFPGSRFMLLCILQADEFLWMLIQKLLL